MKMDEKTQIELEAAAFRHLVGFLQEKTDVQNIDLMNLAGFCRNCLSKWYVAAAEERPPSRYRHGHRHRHTPTDKRNHHEQVEGQLLG